MKKILIIVTMFIVFITVSQINVQGIGATYVGEGLIINLDEPTYHRESFMFDDYDEVTLLDYGFNDDVLPNFNCFYFCLFYLIAPRFSAMNNQMYILNSSEAEKFFRYGNNLTTGVYEQTDRFHADIIAYYNQNNQLIHVGHVVEAFNGSSNNICGDSNLVKIISKWDIEGIYEHMGDCCPYTSTYGGTATYVKYYKYCYFHTCSHNYFSNLNEHHCECDCGNLYCNFKLRSHICNYSYTKLNANYHNKLCLSCDYIIQESHNWQKISDILFKCTNCNQKATYVENYHDSLNSSDKNLLFSIYCDGNYYTVKLID